MLERKTSEWLSLPGEERVELDATVLDNSQESTDFAFALWLSRDYALGAGAPPEGPHYALSKQKVSKGFPLSYIMRSFCVTRCFMAPRKLY